MTADITATGDGTSAFTENGSAAKVFDTFFAAEPNTGYTEIIFTISNVAGTGADESIEIGNRSVTLENGSTASGGQHGTAISVALVGGTATVTVTWTGDGISESQLKNLMEDLEYDNNSDDPTAGAATRVFDITHLTDADGQVAAAGFTDGSPDSTLTITPVNDAPTVSADDNNPDFTEGAATTALFSNTDIDTIEGDNIIAFTITVSNTEDGAAEELIIDGSTITLVNGSGTTAGNGFDYVVSGGGSSKVTISFTNGSVNEATFEGIIDAITYDIDETNSSEDPTSGDRKITLTSVTDDGGTADGGDDTTSLNISSTVDVNPVNDAPTLTATDEDPGFTEGDSAVQLFSGADAEVVESGDKIKTIEITVTGVLDSTEKLNIDNKTITIKSGSGKTSNMNYAIVDNGGGSFTITLTGSESEIVIENIINNISYEHTSEDPTAGDRDFTITLIQDNGGTSNGGDDDAVLAIESTVTVAGVEDTPTMSGLKSSISADEATAAKLFPNDITISDVDTSKTATPITITLTAQNVNAVLNAAAGQNITVGDDDGDNVITLTGNIDDLNTYLKTASNVTYTGEDDNSNDDIVVIGIDDTEGGADAAYANIDIIMSDVEDAPTLVGNTDTAGNEEEGFNLLGGGDLTVADVDTAADQVITVTFEAEDRDSTITAVDGTGITVEQLKDYKISVTGTAADLNAYLTAAGGNITYTGDTDVTGTDTINISIDDNEGGSVDNIASITVTINNVDDHPLFTSKAYLDLVSSGETDPDGDTILNLFATEFSDPDNDNFAGIAITGDHSTADEGTWQYSTDGGTTWTDIGARSDNNALFLDPFDLVRFVPAAGHSGEAGALEVYAVDDSAAFPGSGNSDSFNISDLHIAEDATILGYGSKSGWNNDPNAPPVDDDNNSDDNDIDNQVTLGDDGEHTVGGTGNDSIKGGDGDDTIWAGKNDKGDDTVDGGAGDDIIAGGDGDDVLKGGTGEDHIFGGSGNDTIDTGAEDGSKNSAYGGNGNDVITGSGGSDTIGGGNGNDNLSGGTGADIFFGGRDGGDDTISGGSGHDIMYAGSGSDSLAGGGGSDTIFNGAGSDNVNGGGGNDIIWGGPGNDTLTGGSGNDFFKFAVGNDEDVITDFDINADTIDFTETKRDFTDLASVQANATAEVIGGQAGVLIDTGSGDSVFIIGIVLTDLQNITFVYGD